MITPPRWRRNDAPLGRDHLRIAAGANGRGNGGSAEVWTRWLGAERLQSVGIVRHVAGGDDTPIGYRVDGEGPPLLLVHGSGTTSGDWIFLTPFLRDRFTVVTMDRRGRGQSGDSPHYAMELEAQDVLAVVEAVGAAFLVAHSYGALCSMLAAARMDDLRALVLYEPPISVPIEMAVGVRRRVEAGEHEEVLVDFLRAVGTSPQQLAAIRESRAWSGLVATSSTLPRELEAATVWKPPPTQAIDTRVLYLLGEETTDGVYLERLEETQEAFSDVTTVRLPGQMHVAHVFAADAFAARIAAFLAG